MIPRDKLRKAAPFVKAACDHRYRMNVCKAMVKEAFNVGLDVGKARIGIGAGKDILGNYTAGAGAASPSGGVALVGNASPKLLRNAAIGAGAGALAGLIREKFKGEDKKKKYLKSLLLGALAGGGVGAAGTMVFNSPDYSKKIKKLVKRGQEEPKGDKKIDYVARRRKLKLILGALIGGLYGGAVSQSSGSGFGGGALVGAGVGTGLAYGSNKLRDWAGMDPIGTSVTLAKQAPGT